ncbi:MAG: hypothetical protein H0T62_11835 [Parachlamydiaceae bacterium]|nr:hypothetical protein [Parachlamydiaceae bacterium]
MITNLCQYFYKETSTDSPRSMEKPQNPVDELRGADRALKSYELHQVILDTRTKIEEARKEKY